MTVNIAGFCVMAYVAKEDNFWVKKCMEYEVSDQEVDQRELGERLCNQGGCCVS